MERTGEAEGGEGGVTKMDTKDKRKNIVLMTDLLA